MLYLMNVTFGVFEGVFDMLDRESFVSGCQGWREEDKALVFPDGLPNYGVGSIDDPSNWYSSRERFEISAEGLVELLDGDPMFVGDVINYFFEYFPAGSMLTGGYEKPVALGISPVDFYGYGENQLEYEFDMMGTGTEAIGDDCSIELIAEMLALYEKEKAEREKADKDPKYFRGLLSGSHMDRGFLVLGAVALIDLDYKEYYNPDCGSEWEPEFEFVGLVDFRKLVRMADRVQVPFLDKSKEDK